MNKLDADRGNVYHDKELTFPLSLVDVIPLPGPNEIISKSIYTDKYLVIQKQHTLSCFDIDTRQLQWERKLEDRTNSYMELCNDDAFYLVIGENINKINIHTGKTILTFDKGEYIFTAKSKHLITEQLTGDKIWFRNIDNLSLDWEFEYKYGFRGALLYENGLYVLEQEQGMQIIDGSNGLVLQEFVYLDLLTEHFSEQLANWRKMPGGGDYTATKTPYIYSHCLIDGVVYMSCEIGVAMAMDIRSGQLLWYWDNPRKWKHKPMNGMIYHDGVLYCHDQQHRGHESYLYFIDAKTGETLFDSEEKMSPRGCSRMVMVGKYLLGSGEDYLSVWDIEKHERIWLYQYPKGNIFRTPAVTTNGLVYPHTETNSLYWFVSE